MTRALVVEDNPILCRIYEGCLDEILGKNETDIVNNYQSAIAHLNSNEYGFYFINETFPRIPRVKAGLNGPELAEEIAKRENGSYDKIRIISSNRDILAQAFKEIPNRIIYDQRRIWKMFEELKQELNP